MGVARSSNSGGMQQQHPPCVLQGTASTT